MSARCLCMSTLLRVCRFTCFLQGCRVLCVSVCLFECACSFAYLCAWLLVGLLDCVHSFSLCSATLAFRTPTPKSPDTTIFGRSGPWTMSYQAAQPQDARVPGCSTVFQRVAFWHFSFLFPFHSCSHALIYHSSTHSLTRSIIHSCHTYINQLLDCSID